MKNILPSNISRLLSRHGVPFIVSLTLAEMFYELGSFSLELLAFGATWLVTSYAFGRVKKWVTRMTHQSKLAS